LSYLVFKIHLVANTHAVLSLLGELGVGEDEMDREEKKRLKSAQEVRQ
jgi:hypothetical protein